MIRILHVIGKMDVGGAETFIMNVYRKINRDKIQFDFMVHSDEVGVFDEEIDKLGGKIYNIDSFNGVNSISYAKKWDDFFNQHSEFTALHGHIGSSASIYLRSAKKHGIYAIAHSHYTYTFNKFSFLHKPLTLTNRFLADSFFACSYEAGYTRYGKKVVSNTNIFSIVKNGIDPYKYAFNETTRKRMRDELGINNEYVVGMVGRLIAEKNPNLILKVIQSFSSDDNIKFLWIGEGELRDYITLELRKYHLEDKVQMIGTVLNVQDYLQAMDVFLFPSISEGLGIALIEAQASGLPCVISMGIPDEAIITNLCKKIDFKKDINTWRDAIKSKLDYARDDMSKSISRAGYDINDTVAFLEKFYCDIEEDKYE